MQKGKRLQGAEGVWASVGQCGVRVLAAGGRQHWAGQAVCRAGSWCACIPARGIPPYRCIDLEGRLCVRVDSIEVCAVGIACCVAALCRLCS